MVYFLGLGLLYFSWVVETFTRYKGNFFYCSSLLFCGALAVLRGQVGTDTHNYEVITGSFREGAGIDGWEPGFVWAVKFLQVFFTSDSVVIRLVSLCFTLALIRLVFKGGRDWRYFIMIFFVPAYFFAYSMNVLRLGLATLMMFYLVVSVIEGNKIFKAVLFGVAAVLFQYSIIFSLFFIGMASIKFWQGKRLVWVLVACSLAIGFLFLKADYVIFKLNTYSDSDYVNVGGFSGLSIVVVVCIILMGVMFSNLPRAAKGKLVCLGGGMMLVFYLMAFYTYAGLRLLDLLSVSLALAAVVQHAQADEEFNAFFKVSLFLAGLTSALFTAKGFIQFEGVGDSPFLPYHFFGNDCVATVLSICE